MIVHPLCTHISNMQIVRICVHSQCSSCVFTYIIVTAFCTLARDTVHPGLCVTIQPCHAPQFSHSQCIQLLYYWIYSCPSWPPPPPPPTHTHALSMQRLLLQFVLPALTAEFVDRRMIPFVLPNILLVAEGLTSDEYLTHVLPSLLPVFQMEEPVQVSTLW